MAYGRYRINTLGLNDVGDSSLSDIQKITFKIYRFYYGVKKEGIRDSLQKITTISSDHPHNAWQFFIHMELYVYIWAKKTLYFHPFYFIYVIICN